MQGPSSSAGTLSVSNIIAPINHHHHVLGPTHVCRCENTTSGHTRESIYITSHMQCRDNPNTKPNLTSRFFVPLRLLLRLLLEAQSAYEQDGRKTKHKRVTTNKSRSSKTKPIKPVLVPWTRAHCVVDLGLIKA